MRQMADSVNFHPVNFSERKNPVSIQDKGTISNKSNRMSEEFPAALKTERYIIALIKPYSFHISGYMIHIQRKKFLSR